MAKQSLTKEQDQARLADAAFCSKCKRIWQTYSNDFCNEHSVSAWKIDPAKPMSSRSAPRRSFSQPHLQAKPASTKKKPVTASPLDIPMWKIALGWVVGLSALLGACMALAIVIPDSWAEKATSTTVPKTRPKTFPNFINMTFGEAVEEIRRIDPEIFIGYVEAINNSNDKDEMIVVDQAPPVGAPTIGVMEVCLMIVNKGSQFFKRNYVFSDSCPKSQGDVLAEIASAWIPAGFAELGNERTQGFAVELEGTFDDCTWEGVKGRCRGNRLASKNGCVNGAAIVVKWLNSLNQVIDTSIFSTRGRIERGGIFEYVAFLPYSRWDKPVSSMLYQVRC